MTISEQIKVLCVRCNISVAELARRMGTTPQNFNSKIKSSTAIIGRSRNKSLVITGNIGSKKSNAIWPVTGKMISS